MNYEIYSVHSQSVLKVEREQFTGIYNSEKANPSFESKYYEFWETKIIVKELQYYGIAFERTSNKTTGWIEIKDINLLKELIDKIEKL